MQRALPDRVTSQQRGDELAADPATEPLVAPTSVVDEQVPYLDGVVHPQHVTRFLHRDTVAEVTAAVEMPRERGHAGESLGLQLLPHLRRRLVRRGCVAHDELDRKRCGGDAREV